jgi:hypothetical protein
MVVVGLWCGGLNGTRSSSGTADLPLLLTAEE